MIAPHKHCGHGKLPVSAKAARFPPPMPVFEERLYLAVCFIPFRCSLWIFNPRAQVATDGSVWGPFVIFFEPSLQTAIQTREPRVIIITGPKNLAQNFPMYDERRLSGDRYAARDRKPY
jgi:hypothetical protein